MSPRIVTLHPTKLLIARGESLRVSLDSFVAEQGAELQRACEALRGGTLFVCGNGGSAAHAAHLEAELVGRYTHEREPRASVYLGMSPSSTTAIANDYGAEHVFARPLRALAREGDALLVLSTSGTSPNVMEALQVARELGVRSVLLSGPRAAPDAADVVLRFPGERADAIQDGHQLVVHALMDVLDPPP